MPNDQPTQAPAPRFTCSICGLAVLVVEGMAYFACHCDRAVVPGARGIVANMTADLAGRGGLAVTPAQGG